MTKQLKRLRHAAGEAYNALKSNRAWQAPANAAAAALWGLLGAPERTVFLADAGAPSAVGDTLTVQLAAGLMLVHEPTSDPYTHDMRIAVIDEVLSVPVESNGEADPRIDLVCLRALEVEGDGQQVQVKDALTNTTTTVTRNQTVRYGAQYLVVKGEPAAVPEAPDVPAGWEAVAHVEVTPSQAFVASDDVTDVRDTSAFSLPIFRGSQEIQIGAVPTLLRQVWSGTTSRLSLLVDDGVGGTTPAHLVLADAVVSRLVGRASDTIDVVSNAADSLGWTGYLGARGARLGEVQLFDASDSFANGNKPPESLRARISYDRVLNRLGFSPGDSSVGFAVAASRFVGGGVIKAAAVASYNSGGGGGTPSFSAYYPIVGMNPTGNTAGASSFTFETLEGHGDGRIVMGFAWHSGSIRPLFAYVNPVNKEGDPDRTTYTVSVRAWDAATTDYVDAFGVSYAADQTLWVALIVI